MSAGFGLFDARGRGWLEKLDPRLKLAWLALVSLLSVLFDSTTALAVLFLSAMLVATGLRIRPRGWMGLAGLMLAVAWGTLLSQMLFYERVPRTVLLTIIPPGDLAGWEFPGLRFYREGAAYGLAQSLRSLAVMVTGLAVCLSTSPERLLAAVSRLPVPVGFTAVAALRFLPTVLEEIVTVRRARRLRGYRMRLLSPHGLMTTIRVELAVLLPILSNALRRASALATSVTSRGFDPSRRRTYFPPLEFRLIERMLLAVLVVLFLAITTAKALYWLYLGEFFYNPALRWLYQFVREWL